MRNLHIGTMGWSYNFWKESFYPENLQANEFLKFYSSKLDTVEADSTFYRIPRESTVLNWKAQTPNNFIFSLKFPRIITHIKMLKNCEDETRVFLERVELLGEKLGALLLQLPPSFRKEQVPLLEKFLRPLPKTHRYVVEIKNKTLLKDSLFSTLRENKVSLAWVDSALPPQVSEVTSDFIYVRWQGDRKKVNGTLGKTEIDKANEIRLWASKLKTYVENGKVFGYYSKYYSGNPTADAQYFLTYVKNEE